MTVSGSYDIVNPHTRQLLQRSTANLTGVTTLSWAAAQASRPAATIVILAQVSEIHRQHVCDKFIEYVA